MIEASLLWIVGVLGGSSEMTSSDIGSFRLTKGSGVEKAEVAGVEVGSGCEQKNDSEAGRVTLDGEEAVRARHRDCLDDDS